MTHDDSRRVSLLMGLLFGLAGMGSSSAAVVLPRIAGDLGVSVGVSAWTISLYTLMLGVTTAVYGRISDLVGIRRPLAVGVSLMVAGAIGSAAAPSFGVLLAARFVQGSGAAAVATLGVAALSHRYDGAVRGLALSRLAGMAAAVTCLGPLLGGAIEGAVGWRGVMALPVLGALVLPALWPALTSEGTGARLDLVGAALVALTAGGLVLTLQSPATGLLTAVVGVTLLVAGVPVLSRWVRRRPDGFLPLVVVRNRTVVSSALAAAGVPASWFALLVGVPAVLVDEQGWAPWEVGLLLLPSAALALVIPRFVGPTIARLGAARTLGLAAITSSASLLCTAAGTATSFVPLLALTVVLTTVAFGVGQPAMTACISEAVETSVRGVAIGVATLVFLVGGSIGSATVGGLGEAIGVPAAMMLLALLPAVGLVALAREIRLGPARPSAEIDPEPDEPIASALR